MQLLILSIRNAQSPHSTIVAYGTQQQKRRAFIAGKKDDDYDENRKLRVSTRRTFSRVNNFLRGQILGKSNIQFCVIRERNRRIAFAHFNRVVPLHHGHQGIRIKAIKTFISVISKVIGVIRGSRATNE